MSDTKVYEPEIRALLETAPHLCEVVVLKLAYTSETCSQVKNAGAAAGASAAREQKGKVQAAPVPAGAAQSVPPFFFFITFKPSVE